MYDRAPRMLTKGQESTPATVGPGSYEPEAPAPSKLKADGYAPFSSMTTRETFLVVHDSVIAAPGPGHYDHMSDLRITGGHSLANRSRRFEEPVSKTPGPGTYNLSKRGDWIKKTGVQTQERDGDKSGSLVTSRIRYSRKPQAPSIPTPGQAYGYEEHEDGTLKKQEPPQRDATIGPAYYAPPHINTKTTSKYKGVHFGRLTSKRMDFDGQGGPGPGEYDPFAPVEKNLELLNAPGPSRNTSRAFESKLPRYHEVIVHQEEKKAVPGPGKYEINSQFDKRPQAVNTEGMEVDHPPFMSQSKRFLDQRHSAPAPGTYNDPRHALEALGKIRGLKRSPFGQTAVRFMPQPHIQKTPGPGSYSFSGLAGNSLRKAYMESTRRGAFGSTSVRIKPITKREDTAQPGPAHYQVKDRPHYSRYSQNVSANFASQTERLHSPPPVIKENPPPGSYEVSKSYDISQGKKEPAIPRTDTGKRKKGSFLSSSTRFAPPRDVLLEKPDIHNPGPGTYNPDSIEEAKNGLMVTRDKRFKEKRNEYPGPGTYELSPLLQDTVLKGTFNATLNNPVAPQAEISRTNSVMQKQAFVLGV
ncbi:sperm-tail PG-rich repeat-containing protein 2-like [Acanthaster planci]|uniref:Sperm-tail PG-rich repeat-containing protein 2-like n=1 Tax=Acanthaster planci TaxID=133434 RepID=A0A8B7Y6S9_ACAPL|nr:sperm-tail PG-rich repeat-containing protein 2-like [Acanthaster planci]